jgi:hypothetical protein
MTEDKKKRLQVAGFQVGSVAEFLELTPEQQEKIENVIIRNGKPIGVCECLGNGKDNCRGNGWIRDGSGYQICPYFESWSK